MVDIEEIETSQSEHETSKNMESSTLLSSSPSPLSFIGFSAKDDFSIESASSQSCSDDSSDDSSDDDIDDDSAKTDDDLEYSEDSSDDSTPSKHIMEEKNKSDRIEHNAEKTKSDTCAKQKSGILEKNLKDLFDDNSSTFSLSSLRSPTLKIISNDNLKVSQMRRDTKVQNKCDSVDIERNKTIVNPYKKPTFVKRSKICNESSLCKTEISSTESVRKIQEITKAFKTLSENEKKSKFHQFHYSPPPYKPKPEPLVVNLTFKNRPVSSRKLIPVSHVFHPPISQFFQQKFHSFNHMQSELAPILNESQENVVVSAPTGAGKTCIFEIAMGRLLVTALEERRRGVQKGGSISRDQKIVYIAPSKALCDERYEDWSQRLNALKLGIVCSLVTGDSLSENTFQSVASSHLILTTPEKWDSITRKWTDHVFLLGSIKLLLMDEVHLLGDGSRGACLEALVCRMKAVERAASKASTRHQLEGTGTNNIGNHEHKPFVKIRIVAVSATLPNINDIASFLDAPKSYAFDSSFRPVPLTTKVIGMGYVGKNQFLFDKSLNKHVPTLMRQESNHKSVIIFCHSKKETEILALDISKYHYHRNLDFNQLVKISNTTSVMSLSNCIKKGVAFHHAGLSPEDRKIVEQNFSKGSIRTLCATSTLAMGVNLPAYLVIIKGTVAWRGTGLGHQEIDTGTLLQMMGRAGRPGFDTSGKAIILTDKKSIKKYEKLSHGLEVVESQLLQNLVEILNTEVSQKVITNISEAIDWLKNTFFFSRVRKNPLYYGMQGKTEQEMDTYLMSHVMKTLAELDEYKVISMNTNGLDVQPLPGSHVMSQHMVEFEAMKKLMKLKHDAGLKQILMTLSECGVLHRPVRRSEKKILNEVHTKVKFPIDVPASKIRIQSPSHKAFILLQASIGQNYLDDFTLRQEMSYMVDNSTRILGALEDYSILETKHGKLALNSLLLRRSLTTSLWGSKSGVLNQLKGVGAKTTAKLSTSGIISFPDVLSHTSYDIEHACGRKHPFGQELRKAVNKILHNTLELSASIQKNENDIPQTIAVHLTKVDSSRFKSLEGMKNSPSDDKRIVKYTLSVHTDRPGGSLIFRSDIWEPGEHKISCPPLFGQIYIRIVSNLIGLDIELALDGNVPITKSPVRMLCNEKSPTPKKICLSNSNKNGKKTNFTKTPFASNKEKRMSMTINQIDEYEGADDLRISRAIVQKASILRANMSPEEKKKKSSVPVSSMSSISPSNNTVVTPSPIPQNYKNEGREPHKPCNNTNVLSTPSSNVPVNPYKERQIKEVIDVEKLAKIPRNDRIRSQSTNTVQTSPQNLYLSKIKENINRSRPWQREKQKQSMMQKHAFSSPRENPFSTFKFDPNNVESKLDSLSKQTSIQQRIETNTSFMISRGNARSRFHQKNNVTRPSNSYSVLRGKRRRTVTSGVCVGGQDLLRLKASEQAAFSRRNTTMKNNYSGQNNFHNVNSPRNLDMDQTDNGVFHQTQNMKSPFQQWKERRNLQQHSIRNHSHNSTFYAPYGKYNTNPNPSLRGNAVDSYNQRPLFNSMDPNASSNIHAEDSYNQRPLYNSMNPSEPTNRIRNHHHHYENMDSQYYYRATTRPISQVREEGISPSLYGPNHGSNYTNHHQHQHHSYPPNDDYEEWEFDPSMPQEIFLDNHQVQTQTQYPQEDPIKETFEREYETVGPHYNAGTNISGNPSSYSNNTYMQDRNHTPLQHYHSLSHSYPNDVDLAPRRTFPQTEAHQCYHQHYAPNPSPSVGVPQNNPLHKEHNQMIPRDSNMEEDCLLEAAFF